MQVELRVGAPAPDFALPRDGGGTVSLKTLKGQIVVLYFYPKDNTEGCTLEARSFTAEVAAFAAAGAVILGVSKDSVRSHDRFRDRHELKIALLSDTDGSVADSYGVRVPKQMFGKPYMGTLRSTFLIDRQGMIHQIWKDIDVEGHIEDVLNAVRALNDARRA